MEVLLDAEALAARLRLESRDAGWRAMRERAVPGVVQLGGRRKRVVERLLDLWIVAGCPPNIREFERRHGFGAHHAPEPSATPKPKRGRGRPPKAARS